MYNIVLSIVVDDIDKCILVAVFEFDPLQPHRGHPGVQDACRSLLFIDMEAPSHQVCVSYS